MATSLAPVVVFDPCARHHWTVHVLRHLDCVVVSCLECDHEERGPLSDIAGIWESAKRQEGVQVLVWIEVNGECGHG